jgi:protein TonB
VIAPAKSGDSEARLEGRIREAVQAAVHYPPAARMMGVTGRARVLLDYQGGAVDNPTLAQSSGAPLLDTAALAAARDAHYPKPPPDLEGQRLRFLVWVEFRTG